MQVESVRKKKLQLKFQKEEGSVTWRHQHTLEYTMDSVRTVVYLSFCLSVLTSFCQGQRPEDNQLPSLLDESILGFRELAETLQGVLHEADSRAALSVEKKASVIPRCDVGERCAMKHGPRIGRLCDCLRGTACNTFFLRCY
ncbi:LOW QUALITY PROTEIN: cocaine- and amphetamine-regulated transcript 4 [Thalassophryne amazonica]|uniref:LOW QUALITY PROTEIN: cocaine- and amphetamine-regulated transcript 4 n=1 Tax=Thalassophryne amazonica TaxID=390379 RepID=UPI0014712CE5|nr:LOW QUALITY PROTEIN: cocaine- and amphetamine-regulated transcript 4 [Thalassophryne amazonica]